MINRIILSVKVNCVNAENGCQWIGEVADMKTHQNISCGYEEISCSFVGCVVMIERDRLKEHQTMCEYRTVACDYCNNDFQYQHIPIHLKTCEFFPVVCSNECQATVPRNKMSVHLTECELSLICCSFSSVGCTVRVLKKDLNDHLQKANQGHSLMMLQNLQNMQGKLHGTQEKLHTTQEKLQSTQEELHGTQEELKMMRQENCIMKEEFQLQIKLLTDNSENVVCNLEVDGEVMRRFNNFLDEKYKDALESCRNKVCLFLADNVDVSIELCEVNIDGFAASTIVQDFIDIFETSKVTMNLPALFWDRWEKQIKHKFIVDASFKHLSTIEILHEEITQLKFHSPMVDLFNKIKEGSYYKDHSEYYIKLNTVNMSPGMRKFATFDTWSMHAGIVNENVVLKSEVKCLPVYVVNFCDGRSVGARKENDTYWKFDMAIKNFKDDGFIYNGYLLFKLC